MNEKKNSENYSDRSGGGTIRSHNEAGSQDRSIEKRDLDRLRKVKQLRPGILGHSLIVLLDQACTKRQGKSAHLCQRAARGRGKSEPTGDSQ